jgi:ADP-ribose pyrophosphatase YjhB (NUDIX family)
VSDAHAETSALPRLLARGPWQPGDVSAHWTDEYYVASEAQSKAADEAIRELRERGSPSHDGMSGRLASFEQADGRLSFELQPLRWSLRLAGDACGSLSALCVTRDHRGRWLAGRRAAWVASWAGRWALGAGGAVDVGESPAHTLARELQEEWSVSAERLQGEALIELPRGMLMFVGQAWLAPGDEERVAPDAEHDAWAWWPADIDSWPSEGDALRGVAGLLCKP